MPRLEKEARINKDKKAALDNALAAQKVLEEGNTLYAAGRGRRRRPRRGARRWGC